MGLSVILTYSMLRLRDSGQRSGVAQEPSNASTAMLLSLLASFPLLASTSTPLVTAQLAGRQYDVHFVQEKPSRLKVRVVRVQAGLSGVAIALAKVEVSNPTDVWAEPLAFSFEVKGTAAQGVAAPRVAPPFGNRAGRAIPPRSSLDYWVNVAAAPKTIAKSGARVTDASFFESDAPKGEAHESHPPATVGKLEELEPEVDFGGNRLAFQQVRLSNTSDRRVDLIFRADFKQPQRGPNLVHCTLEPHQVRDWTIEGATMEVPGFAHFRGSNLSGLELIDWSVLVEQEQEPAKERLRAAYEARAAWPSAKFRYGGRYQVVIERFNWDKNARERVVEEGTFKSEGMFAHFVPGPAKRAEGRAGAGDAPMAEADGWILLNRASSGLTRKSFDEWLGDARVVRHRDVNGLEVVSVLRPNRAGVTPELYWIEDGQVVAEAISPRAAFVAPRWFELEAGATGTVMRLDRERRERQVAPAFPTTYEYEYTTVDGVPIPSKLRMELHVNPESMSTFVTLELFDVRLGGGKEAVELAPVPTGELADQVRAAWDRGYRHPLEPVTLRGSFTVKNAGNDALWRGHRKVQGTFRLAEFTGSGWGDWEITLDGKYAENVARELKGVVIDRFGMFLGRRDYAGRKSFDEIFAGASLEKRGSQIFVRGCAVEQLEIRRGRVEAHTERGTRYDHTWKKMGGTDVVVRYESSPESMLYKRIQLGDWWLTSDVTMKNVFEDWGPETVQWRDLVIE